MGGKGIGSIFLEGGFDDGFFRDCSRKVKFELEEDGDSYKKEVGWEVGKVEIFL